MVASIQRKGSAMAGVKFSSVLFLIVILVAMGWAVQSLLGQEHVEPAASLPAPVAPQPVAQPANANQLAGKVRIGIGGVRVLSGLEEQLAAAGQTALIKRAAESIEAQLMNSLQNTRKFEIVARGDLEELLREQNLKPGAIIDANDPKAAVPAKIKGIQYLLLTTIDDFVDTEQSTFSQDMGLAVSKRTVRMSAIVRIYNTSTGVLFESVSVPVQLEATGTARAAQGDQTKNPRAADDSIYVELMNQLAGRVAARVTDAIFPAKVIEK